MHERAAQDRLAPSPCAESLRQVLPPNLTPNHDPIGPNRIMISSSVERGLRDLAVGQAALTVSRNLPTSSLRRLLSRDSDGAAERTCDEAEPVSPAPRCTSV